MNKKIMLLVIILFMIIVPIIVFATNSFVSYRNGKAVVVEWEEKAELEDGQKYTIAIESGKDSEEYNREQDLKKKRQYEENMYSQDNIAEPSIETYDMKDEELIRYNELQEKTQRTLTLLFEYYGKEEIEELYKNAENSSIKDGKYAISEYAEELLDKILQLVEKEPISAEDKAMLVDMLEQMDLQTLNNRNIEKRLQNLDIEVDK